MITDTIINLKTYEGTLEELKEFLIPFFEDERKIEIHELVRLYVSGMIGYDFEPLKKLIHDDFNEIIKITNETFETNDLTIDNFRNIFLSKINKSTILREHLREFLDKAIRYEDYNCENTLKIEFIK